MIDALQLRSITDDPHYKIWWSCNGQLFKGDGGCCVAGGSKWWLGGILFPEGLKASWPTGYGAYRREDGQ